MFTIIKNIEINGKEKSTKLATKKHGLDSAVWHAKTVGERFAKAHNIEIINISIYFNYNNNTACINFTERNNICGEAFMWFNIQNETK